MTFLHLRQVAQRISKSLNWFNEEPRLPGQGLRDPYLPSLYLSATFYFPPTLLVLVNGVLWGNGGRPMRGDGSPPAAFQVWELCLHDDR